MESLNQDDYEAKEKMFYSAMISAWLNTKIERDKQLLGLSATAIGLLVTLLRTTRVNNISQIIIFGLAMLFFLITVISVIGILDQNANHIEKVLDNREVDHNIPKYLDKIAECSFIVGMILIVIIGIHTAILNLDKKGVSMNQDKTPHNYSQFVENQEKSEHSWHGVSRLRPQPPKPQPSEPSNNPSPNASEPSGSSDSGDSSQKD